MRAVTRTRSSRLPDRQGDTLILELDDGRTIEVDRRELLDRAA
jgi:hypothetical protein